VQLLRHAYAHTRRYREGKDVVVAAAAGLPERNPSVRLSG